MEVVLNIYILKNKQTWITSEGSWLGRRHGYIKVHCVKCCHLVVRFYTAGILRSQPLHRASVTSSTFFLVGLLKDVNPKYWMFIQVQTFMNVVMDSISSTNAHSWISPIFLAKYFSVLFTLKPSPVSCVRAAVSRPLVYINYSKVEKLMCLWFIYPKASWKRPTLQPPPTRGRTVWECVPTADGLFAVMRFGEMKCNVMSAAETTWKISAVRQPTAGGICCPIKGEPLFWQSLTSEARRAIATKSIYFLYLRKSTKGKR